MKSNKVNPGNGTISNRILSGTVITGDIQTDGDFRLDGEIRGQVNVKGKFVIGEKGKLDGEVLCSQATISGKIKGSIMASESLTLTATASVNGEIKTDKLAVEPGASFTGNCQMGGVIREMKEKDAAQRHEKEKTA